MRDFKPIYPQRVVEHPVRISKQSRKTHKKQSLLVDLKFWVATMVLFSCGYITFSGIYREQALHTVSHIDQTKSFYGLIEMRMQNKDYQPISGIEVYIGKELAGVTNAYGEWYQFVRVPKNEQVQLLFKRGKIAKSLKISSKQFTKKGEEYIFKKRVIFEDAKLPQKAKQLLATKKSNVIDIKKLQSAIPKAIALLTGDVANVFESISIKRKGSSKRLKALEKSVRLEAERLGLEVKDHSNWSLQLSEMRHKSSSYIKVNIQTTFVGATTKSSFLREFNHQDQKLGKKILATVKFHSFRPFPALQIQGKNYLVTSGSHSDYWQNHLVNKIENLAGNVFSLGKKFKLQDDISLTPIASKNKSGESFECNDGGSSKCFVFNMVYPNVGPNSKWQQKTIRLGGLSAGPSVQVYLQGLQAISSPGNLWKVWLKPRSAPELVVIKNNRVVYTKSLLSSKQAEIPKIDLSKVLYAQKRVSKSKI